MIYTFLSNNPSSGDINSSDLPCSFVKLFLYNTIHLAWFAVYPIPISQLLHMHVMATPYIFLFKQKILTKHL